MVGFLVVILHGEINHMNLQTMIEQMSQAFVKDTRNDGTEFVKLKDDSPEWMTQIIFLVHEGYLPADEIYETVERVIDHLHDDGVEDEDTARDSIFEIEVPIYTSELTEWLNQRNDHVYYLTEALENYPDTKDGFGLLGLAYHIYQQEIANRVINALVEKLEEFEDEEDAA